MRDAGAVRWDIAMAEGALESYLRRLDRGLDRALPAINRRATMASRVRRSFSMRRCADLIGVSYAYLTKAAAQMPGFPEGTHVGRERVFTLDELMRIRALLAASAKRPRDMLAWRRPLDPLPVISFASQKGGTGKSLSAAHFAQYLSLRHGMRVGLIDADPQHTLTLYFLRDEGGMVSAETPTLVDFAGLYAHGEKAYTDHDAATLDSFFVPTPWPGTRILPASGETSEGELQIARLIRAAPKDRRFYRYVADALDRWREAHSPATDPAALTDGAGRIDEGAFGAALSETFDAIVIDYQPALTIFQLNNLLATTHLVIPQTMKGFDLATLSTFVKGMLGMIEEILARDPLEIGPGSHILLPTIVQRANDQDIAQIGSLMEQAPGLVLPVFYMRSDAVANAADLYQSAYEFDPTPGQRRGLARFVENADAVNDALVARIWPGMERGLADAWIAKFYAEEEG